MNLQELEEIYYKIPISVLEDLGWASSFSLNKHLKQDAIKDLLEFFFKKSTVSNEDLLKTFDVFEEEALDVAERIDDLVHEIRSYRSYIKRKE